MLLDVQPQNLASASADCTVKLWDLSRSGAEGSPLQTLTHHRDKVQAVEWNPGLPNMLLTGGFDQTVVACDARKARVVPRMRVRSPRNPRKRGKGYDKPEDQYE